MPDIATKELAVRWELHAYRWVSQCMVTGVPRGAWMSRLFTNELQYAEGYTGQVGADRLLLSAGMRTFLGLPLPAPEPDGVVCVLTDE